MTANSLFRVQTLIFDLDGTLWNTNATCALAWNEVARRVGLSWREISEKDIESVVGRTHREAVGIVFRGLEDAWLDRICALTSEEDNRMIAERGGELFDGVSTGIPRLAARYPLMIVSNCQAGYIEVFRSTSGLDAHFVDHECWGNTGHSKGENLKMVIERNQALEPVFIGDTEGDRKAARDNGLPFVHASYGFGEVSEADAVIEHFDGLVDLFLDAAS